MPGLGTPAWRGAQSRRRAFQGQRSGAARLPKNPQMVWALVGGSLMILAAGIVLAWPETPRPDSTGGITPLEARRRDEDSQASGQLGLAEKSGQTVLRPAGVTQ